MQASSNYGTRDRDKSRRFWDKVREMLTGEQGAAERFLKALCRLQADANDGGWSEQCEELLDAVFVRFGTELQRSLESKWAKWEKYEGAAGLDRASPSLPYAVLEKVQQRSLPRVFFTFLLSTAWSRVLRDRRWGAGLLASRVTELELALERLVQHDRERNVQTRDAGASRDGGRAGQLGPQGTRNQDEVSRQLTLSEGMAQCIQQVRDILSEPTFRDSLKLQRARIRHWQTIYREITKRGEFQLSLPPDALGWLPDVLEQLESSALLEEAGTLLWETTFYQANRLGDVPMAQPTGTVDERQAGQAIEAYLEPLELLLALQEPLREPAAETIVATRQRWKELFFRLRELLKKLQAEVSSWEEGAGQHEQSVGLQTGESVLPSCDEAEVSKLDRIQRKIAEFQSETLLPTLVREVLIPLDDFLQTNDSPLRQRAQQLRQQALAKASVFGCEELHAEKLKGKAVTEVRSRGWIDLSRHASAGRRVDRMRVSHVIRPGYWQRTTGNVYQSAEVDIS